MKKNIKTFLVVLIFIFIAGCANLNWVYYYPYCQINPNYINRNQPGNFENCLAVIDTVLSKEAKAYFKSEDSSIAVLEICDHSNGIAGLFVHRWCLDYYWRAKMESPDNTVIYDPQFPSLIYRNFVLKGVDDPEAMIRVIFSCYYKKLNNIKYDWDTEIKNIKSYWINVKYGEGRVSPQMRMREGTILNAYRLKQLEVLDTVDVLYNRPPGILNSTPDWYYLTGIIQYKIPEKESINVKLINISSEFGTNYMVDLKDTLAIGDTMTVYSRGWLKRGTYYFDYLTNKEYREFK